MNIADRYTQLQAEYIPPDGNYENIEWHRRWHALSVLMREVGGDIEILNLTLHALSGWADKGTWEHVLTCYNVPNGMPKEFPPKPEQRYVYDREPEAKIDDRARAIFEQQFRKQFPRKRLTAKFALAKWDEVKDKARQFAQQDYDRAHGEWAKRQQARNAAYQKELDAWQARVDHLTHIKTTLERLAALS